MKLAVNTQLKDIEGKDMLVRDKPLTVRAVATEALLALYQDEQNLDGESKLRRYKIALKLNTGAEEVNLTVEEAAEVKKLVGKAYGPAIVGPVFALFDAE